MARNVAIITGASDGIGLEFAQIFAREGHDLVLVARRREKLDALAEEIAGAGRPKPLVVALDLALPDAPATLAAALEASDVTPNYLVNNAGFGASGAVDAAPLDAQIGMIDLNIRALTALTHRFLPAIIATKGGILNVASVAAFAPGPGMAVYYASKAYVLSFSEALTLELAPKGVKVTALCPGPVATGFQARAGINAKALTNAPGVLSAAETAEAGYRGLMEGRRVVVPGTMNKFLVKAMAWIPHAILLPRVAARQMRRSAP